MAANVRLDVTKDNLVDFHHLLPVITGEEPFRFVVDEWDSEDIVKLTFGDFRCNSNNLNPMGLKPVAFEKSLKSDNGQTSWTIEKKSGWHTDKILLEANPEEVDRRMLDFTLTMELKDGVCVSIDPPLDERRRR